MTDSCQSPRTGRIYALCIGTETESKQHRRVVIADDHPLFVKAIGQVLEDGNNGFEVVGSASSGLQVGPLVARTSPDLVLLDVHMPGLDGLSCLALLRERHPDVTVVVFSGSESQETIERALAMGAAAYIAKSIDPSDLPAVLRQVLGGTVYYTVPRESRQAIAERRRASDNDNLRGQTGLSPREVEVLSAAAKGLSNRAIGKELFLSDQTVKFHLNKIYRKLGVTNRTEATGIAHQFGLVPGLAGAH
jgi:two-component system nitrate/nitrite response regulator NarL